MLRSKILGRAWRDGQLVEDSVDSEGVGEGGREAEGKNALGRRRISKVANE